MPRHTANVVKIHVCHIQSRFHNLSIYSFRIRSLPRYNLGTADEEAGFVDGPHSVHIKLPVSVF